MAITKIKEEPKSIKLTKKGFQIVGDIFRNSRIFEEGDYSVPIKFNGIGSTYVESGKEYLSPIHLVALQDAFLHNNLNNFSQAIKIERFPAKGEVQIISKGKKIIAKTRRGIYNIPLVDKDTEKWTHAFGNKYFHANNLYQVLRDAKELDTPETMTSISWHNREPISLVERGLKILLGHPTIHAYSLGLNQGINAQYDGERRAHFDMYEKNKWDISDNEIDLAIISASVFGNKTTDELKKIEGNLEKTLRYGNFNAASSELFMNSTGILPSQVPKRFNLFQDVLFEAIKENKFQIYSRPENLRVDFSRYVSQ